MAVSKDELETMKQEKTSNDFVLQQLWSAPLLNEGNKPSILEAHTATEKGV